MKTNQRILSIVAFFIIPAAVFAVGKKEPPGPAESQPASAVELHLYAGAGLRVPAEKIIADFETATGHTVSVEWAGMGQLLTRFKTTGVGDVFLSGSEFYVDEIKKDGKTAYDTRLVYHTAVVAVRKDKSNGINTIEDLAKSDLTLAVGDPQAIALGISGEAIMDKSGFGEALRKKVAVRAVSGPQLSMYLLNGDVDAAIIGRSDAVKNLDTLILLPLPPDAPQEVAAIAALTVSEHPQAARQLAEWFAKPESIAVFVEEGYLPLNDPPK